MNAKVKRPTQPTPQALAARPKDNSPGELGDDELMLAAREGSADAFDELVRRHQTQLLRVAKRELGKTQAALDAVQATFLDIYRYVPRYQPTGHFKPFIHKALINHCRMARRHLHRYDAAKSELASEPRMGGAKFPDERILLEEQRRGVEHALAKLSDKHRKVLVLRYTGELSYQEIADTLGLRLGTVKSRLFKGLVQMRTLLEEQR